MGHSRVYLSQIAILTAALAAGGCFEKRDYPEMPGYEGGEGGDSGDGDGDGDGDDDGGSGGGGSDDSGGESLPDGPIDPDPDYVDFANQALEAWDIGLETGVLAGGRVLGDEYTAHHPRNWITVAESDCEADGIGPGLKESCPLGTGTAGNEIIGICETRVFPSGEIVDTTLIVWTEFLESDTPQAEKQAVFIHEAGHCLGLKHQSAKQHVMFETIAGEDRPSPSEHAAVEEVYDPPAEPSSNTAARFFATSSAGNPLRHHDFPQFVISGTIGTEPASAQLPPSAHTLGAPVETIRHYMRRHGDCGGP